MNEEIENTYTQIKDRIVNHEIYQNVKEYSKAKEKNKNIFRYRKIIK